MSISINSSGFNASQLTSLQASLDLAEARWENVITGYQPGISITGVSITTVAGSAFAAAAPGSIVSQGGFYLSTTGTLFVNPAVIDAYASWNGVGPTNPNPAYLGLNYLDDILGHEIGHALGIGTLWDDNGVSMGGTGQYTGTYGVQAYQMEFDPLATFVPVEQAGGTGTPDNHWNQLMRSSAQEGNPSDPWSLSPLTGITDAQGRDFAMELMTGALDPDYGEPFLSMTTVQSLRDMGFTVVPEPSGMVLLACAAGVITTGRRRRSAVTRL
ncbi:PEP-CTERM sorting domain-containing protein [Bythopirellula polymerisocia]|nr:PEP-CTERM sorting domain-containing protein [Bythopirellula polymerisocia]